MVVTFILTLEGPKQGKRKRKEKKDIEPATKKIQHSTGGGRRGINVHINVSFRVADFLACCPIQFWKGLGIFH